MEDTLRALDRTPDAVVTLRYGTEHFANGLITLRIHGDGRVEVEQLRAGTRTLDELRLPAEPDRRPRATARRSPLHRTADLAAAARAG